MEQSFLLEADLKATKDKLGIEHPDVANILDNLADAYVIQGDYDKAESKYKQALEIRKKLQHQNPIDVTVSFIKLAQVYKLQECYGDAETFFRVALAQKKNRLGEKHLDVVKIMNDLGIVLLAQKFYGEAEALLVKALELTKKLSGDKPVGHSRSAKPPQRYRSLEIAESHNSLGLFHYWKQHYEKAEKLLTAALEIRKNILGSEHIDVIASLNNLATVYQSQEFYQEAKVLYTEALETAEKILGEEHPKTQVISQNLKKCLYEVEEKSNCLLNTDLILYQRDGVSLIMQALSLSVEVNRKSVISCTISFQVSPEFYQYITFKGLFNLEAKMQLYNIGDGFKASRNIEIQVELCPDLLTDLSEEAKNPLEVANYLLDLNRKKIKHPLVNTESWYATSVIQWISINEEMNEDVLMKIGYDTRRAELK